ncbi:hypothetical protein SLEP1_g41229 [Rubroshorea leprosula]|uniref:Uncharacterized protein n=1 Tax=Rubroshorea leprosula TaxID=152421 RepID=A0AAV5L5U5_9ROSI|nr:hypothetical protein SLEP1_g41229 [Rubroshorea leprosula]
MKVKLRSIFLLQRGESKLLILELLHYPIFCPGCLTKDAGMQ